MWSVIVVFSGLYKAVDGSRIISSMLSSSWGLGISHVCIRCGKLWYGWLRLWKVVSLCRLCPFVC